MVVERRPASAMATNPQAAMKLVPWALIMGPTIAMRLVEASVALNPTREALNMALVPPAVSALATKPLIIVADLELTAGSRVEATNHASLTHTLAGQISDLARPVGRVMVTRAVATAAAIVVMMTIRSVAVVSSSVSSPFPSGLVRRS